MPIETGNDFPASSKNTERGISTAAINIFGTKVTI